MGESKERKFGLTAQILLALVAGVLVGWAYPEVATSLSFFGEIFMAALKMLIVPLIVVTMIVGVSSLGSPEELGRLGTRTVVYYTLTTMLAVVVGLVVVNAMKPGQTALPAPIAKSLQTLTKAPASQPTRLSAKKYVPSSLTTAFKSVLAQAASAKDKSKQKEAEFRDKLARISKRAAAEVWKAKLSLKAGDDGLQRLEGVARAELIFARVGMRRSLRDAEEMRNRSGKRGPPLTVSKFLHMQIKKILQNPFAAMAKGNVLGLIVFSLVLGLLLVSLGERGKPALVVADSLNEAMMRFVALVMKLAPIGVFSLMAYQIARSGLDVLVMLGKYMLCVVAALAFHGLVVLPLMLWIFGKRSPWQFFLQIRDALGVSFSTSSSSATLPVSLEVAEHNAGIRPHVAGFVLPLGSTVNMDGTALYEAIAAMFIAQVYGIDLGLGPQILIFLTAALAAIGAAGIPSAGTVTMVMVLNAVGLPLTGIGLILAVDRLLDMCRTTVNVWGDLIGAAVMERYEPEDARAASLSSS